jgi:D-beta-D-heptose 7-phosphate kinase/D-beta-D-heptose 1-phosphate adenosyltransferase
MKLLVIGDSCTDVFKYGEVNKLAPEAPVPVIKPEKETTNPGMAGNVVANLKALGADVDFITNKEEIRKVRYVCSKYNHLLLRVDENDKCRRIDIENTLVEIEWDKYDAVIISDYCKGFINHFDIQFIAQSHPLTFLDTKRILGDWADDVTFIKINSSEYENNKKAFDTHPNLLSKCIVTRGPKGCLYQNKVYPTKKVDVKDVSGAGDTFLAGLVENYVTTKDVKSAIAFAQICTTKVVQKLGVSTI